MKNDHFGGKSPVGKLRYTVFIIFAALLVELLPTMLHAQAWYNNSWRYRKALTIDQTMVGTGPHTNFPVLISQTDTDLKARALSSGNDILFTASDGITKLNHEIEDYTSTTGAIMAWVQIPSLSSSANTVIYMYYGNSSAANQQSVNATWSNFKAVWHLNNNSFSDATVNSNNGTNTGTTNTTGKIADGRLYKTSDGADNIKVGNLMGSPSSFTLSAWASLNVSDINASDVISIGDDAVLRCDDQSGAGTDGVTYNGSSSWTTTSSGIEYAGTGWHYLMYSFDNTAHTQKVFVDGVQVASTTSTSAAVFTGGGSNTVIGAHGNGNTRMDFDGIIDEPRVANVSRSAGWALTEYHNQNSPSTFYDIGNQEALKIFTGTGNFSTAARWTSSTLPAAGDYLIIDGACTVDTNAGTNNVAYGSLVMGIGITRSLVWASGGTNKLNVLNFSAGSVVSTFDMTNGGTLVVRGTMTSTNLTFTAGIGTVEVQSGITLPSAFATFNNLTINAPSATVALGGATTVNGDLSITAGTLSTSSFNLSVKGDWSNGGVLNAGTGTVTFTGGNSQTITQTGSGNFYKVTINKSANDVTLADGITINNTLTMTARSIFLGNNDLTIGSSGSISGASSSKFIVTNGTGSLAQSGIGTGGRTGAISFPIGTAATSYTPMSINNTGTSDVFSIRVADNVYKNGTTGTNVTSDLVKKTWFITESVVGGSNVTLTAQWNSADEGTGFARSSCGISHYTASAWDTPTFSAATGSNPYTINRSGITSFSPFAVEENSVPLPITLLFFNVNQDEGKNTLVWATESETNNHGFQIERSINGADFESIGFVDGHDNSKVRIDYTFADLHPNAAGAYYRLRQMDWDGKFEFSPVIYAHALTTTALLYPNPVRESVTITQNENLTSETTVSLVVSSEYGDVIMSYTGTLSAANARLNEKLHTLIPGIYFLSVNANNRNYQQKFMKL